MKCTDYTVSLGPWANTLFVWMKTHLSVVFNTLADALRALINGFLFLLQAPNPLPIIAIFAALVLVLRSN